MIRRNRKGKKHTNAKKVSADGIEFASGLERYCYLALKKAKIFDKYEGETFELQEAFQLPNQAFERQSNGKGVFKLRGPGIRNISYTPDFTGEDFIIETKGRANESFPLRYKMFKRLLFKTGDTRPLFKPQNQKEIDETINLILNGRKTS